VTAPSALNETHDPRLLSWVDSANDPSTDFPVQNLPFGVFRRRGHDEPYRGGVAIGEQIVDLGAVAQAGLFADLAGQGASACAAEKLNGFMALGESAWSALRLSLSRALRQESDKAPRLRPCMVPMAEAEHAVPARIGDYTDFYTSIHHATNAGRLFRPDNPLMPNYRWVPIAYHGRGSSVGVSGQDFHRPLGQTRAADAADPIVEPCRRLDFELEVGAFIGPGNPIGEPIAVDKAERHVFGLCLLNDWSARDIQAWEYQPLGPFLSKSFATTVSPWLVTLEALAPYRVPWTRAANDPQPLPYLESSANRAAGAFDVRLEVLIETVRMREAGEAPSRLSASNYGDAYWSVAQMVAHHTINGCNLQPGDLLGSGTQSGPEPGQGGALIELTEGGKQPLSLDNGESRTFLEDGDTVIMRGWCEKPGASRLGLGEVVGTVLPART
jgi:fumarylacetoacetase